MGLQRRTRTMVHTRRSRFGVTLSVMLGIFVGLAGYTFDYAEGTSYLSNDPKACINCHIMNDEYTAWRHSSHHAVATCNDCHVPHDMLGKYATKLDHGWRHSKGFTLQDFHEPIQIKASSLNVVQHNCVRCHAELTSEIATSNGHGSDAQSTNCVHCHSSVGHDTR